MKDNQFTKYFCFKKLGILQITNHKICYASSLEQFILVCSVCCPVSISDLVSSLKSSWLKESCVTIKK